MSRLRLAAIGLTLLVAACAGPGGPGGGSSSPSSDPTRPDTTVPGALATLNGLSAGEIERRFGPPSFRHTDPPAEVWQYRTRVCTLDLFLYRQLGVRLTVSHAAVRSSGGPTVSESDCLRAVQAGR